MRVSAPSWTSVKLASATGNPGAVPVPATAGGGRLGRLLAPRSIAFVGGDIAAMAMRRCEAAGFKGRMYAVHPSRAEVGGVTAVADVGRLPEVPDAAFVGVNREATVTVVRQLAEMGAGGCVCYAAGFDEVGDKGGDLQQRLVDLSHENEKPRCDAPWQSQIQALTTQLQKQKVMIQRLRVRVSYYKRRAVA